MAPITTNVRLYLGESLIFHPDGSTESSNYFTVESGNPINLRSIENTVITFIRNIGGGAEAYVQIENIDNAFSARDLYNGSKNYTYTINVFPTISPQPSRIINIELVGVENTAGLPIAGNDDLAGTSSSDTVNLLGGDDRYFAYGGHDDVLGKGGHDKLYGNQGADTLQGGRGEDTLYGGRGNDVVAGGRDNDLLDGGARADLYVFDANSGQDVVLGFNAAEGDRLDLQGQEVVSKESRTPDTGGNVIVGTILTLSGGGTIELAGITPAEVNASFFA